MNKIQNALNQNQPLVAVETAQGSTCLKVLKISLLCFGIAAAVAAPFVMPAVAIALGITGGTLLLTALALHLFWKPESKASAINNNNNSAPVQSASHVQSVQILENRLLKLVKDLREMGVSFSIKTEESKITLMVGNSTIELILDGDITKEAADVIVNAANNEMLTGGGVDGAICQAGGEELALARALNPTIPGNPKIRCPTGEARITDAGNLPSLFCAHAVAPNCNHSYSPENPSELLQSAYASTLKAAHRALFETDPFEALVELGQNIQNRDDSIQLRTSTLTNTRKKILQHHSSLKTKKMENAPLSISFPTLGTGIFANPKDSSSLIALIEVLKYVKEHQGKEGIKIFKFVFTKIQEDKSFYIRNINQISSVAS